MLVLNELTSKENFQRTIYNNQLKPLILKSKWVKQNIHVIFTAINTASLTNQRQQKIKSILKTDTKNVMEKIQRNAYDGFCKSNILSIHQNP